ncbi:AhpC-TSA-domain-containing protein [Xylona heveae TC161]|uniref:thioredoxin-dependent peroxiredoxin n=1 Tax=Xylona heveae (strain CBS 132557 / TC161) TaxID=1328760 RepID=A0A164ZKA2_XYLHT|nr:AhpC-TSA-domain-containing protein [Xylona heveae TC161]KZF19198.1 AhpC-TSA-domain-containing protein [Xylona heveae TC161]
MSLTTELQNTYNGFHETAPKEVSDIFKNTTADFKASYDSSKAIQPGATFPKFQLSDATGKQVSLDDLLAKGAILISFYRGEWCPFCNLELRALQKHLDEFHAKGVTLVAVSPELPDQSLSTSEKLSLKYPVLSDVDNKLAKQLGILFAQPESVGKVFESFGMDWKKMYGNNSLEVPVPATFLVDKKGILRNSFIDAEYQNRLDPETALKWVDSL